MLFLELCICRRQKLDSFLPCKLRQLCLDSLWIIVLYFVFLFVHLLIFHRGIVLFSPDEDSKLVFYTCWRLQLELNWNMCLMSKQILIVWTLNGLDLARFHFGYKRRGCITELGADLTLNDGSLPCFSFYSDDGLVKVANETFMRWTLIS